MVTKADSPTDVSFIPLGFFLPKSCYSEFWVKHIQWTLVNQYTSIVHKIVCLKDSNCRIRSLRSRSSRPSYRGPEYASWWWQCDNNNKGQTSCEHCYCTYPIRSMPSLCVRRVHHKHSWDWEESHYMIGLWSDDIVNVNIYEIETCTLIWDEYGSWKSLWFNACSGSWVKFLCWCYMLLGHLNPMYFIIISEITPISSLLTKFLLICYVDNHLY